MTDSEGAPEITLAPEDGGRDRLSGSSYWLAIAMGSAGVVLTINQTFNLHLFGQAIIDTSFYYLLLGSVPVARLPRLSGARCRPRRRFPGTTGRCSSPAIAATSYLAWNGGRIVAEGWDLAAPTEAIVIAGIICLLALEGVRRAGGPVLFILCAVFAVYPMFAGDMPGFLWGPSSGLAETLSAHGMGVESIIGVPMRTVASLLVGFLVFGSALVVTGGGEFFMALAVALMGRTRGGPAKVAVLSSGFFGSLSGSVISNVVTTGQITIPTMKRVGYPAHYAGAVEACASTGGALMPPVMGAVAFIMAEFLNVPYSTVMIAAVVPALLYYGALLLQADHYAARNGLKGQAAAEIPPLLPVLKQGWHFLFSLGAADLPAAGDEARGAGALYRDRRAARHDHRVRQQSASAWPGCATSRIDTTRNIVNIVAILAGVGFIVGSLSYTGVGGAFSRELLQFAGGNVYLLLVARRAHQLHSRHGDDGQRLLHLPGHHAGAGADRRRAQPDRRPPVHPLLGPDQLHHAAGGAGGDRRCQHRRADPWQTGVWAMRLGLVQLRAAVPVRAQPDADPDRRRRCTSSTTWRRPASRSGCWRPASKAGCTASGAIGWTSRLLLIAGALGLLVPGIATDLIGLGLLAVVYLGNLLWRRRSAVR